MNGTLVNVATVLAGPGAKNVNETNMVEHFTPGSNLF